MITNEREYRIARADYRRFEEQLAAPPAESHEAEVHPLFASAGPAILKQQLEDLRAEIREYEELRSGAKRLWRVSRLEEMPQILIESRIANGLTQRELGEMLGIKEQAVQRYEENRYGGSSFDRIIQVGHALGLHFNVSASLEAQIASISDIGSTISFGITPVEVSSAVPLSDRILQTAKTLHSGWKLSGLSNQVSTSNWKSAANRYVSDEFVQIAPAVSGVDSANHLISGESHFGPAFLAWPLESNQRLPDVQLASEAVR